MTHGAATPHKHHSSGPMQGILATGYRPSAGAKGWLGATIANSGQAVQSPHPAALSEAPLLKQKHPHIPFAEVDL
jgi:hypothetical protein